MAVRSKIAPLIQELLASPIDPTTDHIKWESTPHASSAGQCERQAWFRYRNYKPTLNMFIVQGTTIDEFLKQQVKLATDEYETNIPVTFPNYSTVGEADLVGANEVLDFKSISERGFDRAVRNGAYDHHKLQVNLYGYGLDKDRFTLFYISRDYFRTFHAAYNTNPVLAQETLERLETVFEQRKASTPPKPFRAQIGLNSRMYLYLIQPGDEWNCRYCRYVEECVAYGSDKWHESTNEKFNEQFSG